MRRPVVAGNWKMNPPTLEEALGLAEAVERAADGRARVDAPSSARPTIWLTAVARRRPRPSRRRPDDALGGARRVHRRDEPAHARRNWRRSSSSATRSGASTTARPTRRSAARSQRGGARPAADRRGRGARRGAPCRRDRGASSTASCGRRWPASTASPGPAWSSPTSRCGPSAPATRPSGADAQAVAAAIRSILRELDADGADEIPIQYGGSVTGDERRRVLRPAGHRWRARRRRLAEAPSTFARHPAPRPHRPSDRPRLVVLDGFGLNDDPSRNALLSARDAELGPAAGRRGRTAGSRPRARRSACRPARWATARSATSTSAPGFRVPPGPAAHQRAPRRRHLLRERGAARRRAASALRAREPRST